MQRVSCSPQEAANIRRLIAHYDASDLLCKVQCPTLVLHNPNDAMVPFEEGRLIASTIVGARLVPFESQNHVPLCGEPAFAEMNRLIDQFVLGDAAAIPARRSSGKPNSATAPGAIGPRGR